MSSTEDARNKLRIFKDANIAASININNSLKILLPKELIKDICDFTLLKNITLDNLLEDLNLSEQAVKQNYGLQGVCEDELDHCDCGANYPCGGCEYYIKLQSDTENQSWQLNALHAKLCSKINYLTTYQQSL